MYRFCSGETDDMRIGIITAMPEETGALLKRFRSVKRGTCGNLPSYSCVSSNHEIVLCEAGMGFDNAARAAEAVIRETSPDILISCGFCGGIASELAVGDIVIATAVVIVSGQQVEEVPVEIPAVCSNFVIRQTAEGARVFGGLFASTPSILSKTKLAALVPPGSKYQVVEMESAAIAIIAVENDIRFAGIRAVSDPFDEELEFSLDEFCDRQKRISIPRVLLTILRKPGIIPQLVRLARNSRVAGVSLAQTMERFLVAV
jgi:adenosylhomocysteine nucleosidase